MADPQSGEKVSPVKPRVLFGTLTSKEKLAADKAGLAISSPGSPAVTSPGVKNHDAGKAVPASAVPSSSLSPLPQVQLVKTKAQKKAAKAKVSPPTQAPDSTVQQPLPKKKGWPKGKAKAKALMKRPAALKRPAAVASKASKDGTLLQL